MIYKSLLSQNKAILKSVIKPGDICVDATLGNGNDLLFLSNLSGKTGQVYGFDIQEEALENSEKMLSDRALYENYILFKCSHEFLMEKIPLDNWLKVKAVIFNLGFLPGLKKSLVTRGKSTLKALDSALKILTTGGIISVMIYSGHEGGAEERGCVLKWAESLDFKDYRVYFYEVFNKIINKETLLIIKKIT